MKTLLIKIPILGLLFMLILTSCSTTEGPDFSGTWLEKEKEYDMYMIEKSDNGYVITNRQDQKYPATVNDGVLEMNQGGFSITGVIDEHGNFIFNGKEYIPFEESNMGKLVGIWKNHSSSDAWHVEYSMEEKRLVMHRGYYDNPGFEARSGFDYTFLQLKYNQYNFIVDLTFGNQRIRQDAVIYFIDDNTISYTRMKKGQSMEERTLERMD